MGAFKEMDPELIRKALEGQQDLLAPEVAKEGAFFRNSTCPSCGGAGLSPTINAKKPFTPGVPLPNKILTCLGCGTEFDPYTRLILRAPISSSD
jgi:hypothetical protein